MRDSDLQRLRSYFADVARTPCGYDPVKDHCYRQISAVDVEDMLVVNADASSSEEVDQFSFDCVVEGFVQTASALGPRGAWGPTSSSNVGGGGFLGSVPPPETDPTDPTDPHYVGALLKSTDPALSQQLRNLFAGGAGAPGGGSAGPQDVMIGAQVALLLGPIQSSPTTRLRQVETRRADPVLPDHATTTGRNA